MTYRTYDGRRKARFLDILSLFNRINNSKIRIEELEALKRQQTHERVEFRQARICLLFNSTDETKPMVHKHAASPTPPKT